MKLVFFLRYPSKAKFTDYNSFVNKIKEKILKGPKILFNRQFYFRLEKGKILNTEDHFIIYQYNIALKIPLGLDIFIFFMFVSKFHVDIMSNSLIIKKIVASYFKMKIQLKVFYLNWIIDLITVNVLLSATQDVRFLKGLFNILLLAP